METVGNILKELSALCYVTYFLLLLSCRELFLLYFPKLLNGGNMKRLLKRGISDKTIILYTKLLKKSVKP